MVDISVIIPSYNYGIYINECLQSIQYQIQENDEIIVVDDGSTDNTEEVVNSVVCSKLKYLRQNNSGPSVARNYGFSLAQGTHVIFLDADDMLGDYQLDSFRKTAEANYGKVIYGPWIRFGKVSGNKVPFEQHEKPDQENLLKAWLLGWYISPCALLWPREIVEKLGGFDPRFTAGEDGEFAKRALIHGINFLFCDASPAWNRMHLDKEIPSLSEDTSESALNQRFKIYLKLEMLMKTKGILQDYRKELAFAFYKLGKHQVFSHSEFADKCYREFKRLLPWGRPPGSIMNWIGVIALGLKKKEKLARFIRCRILNYGNSKIYPRSVK